MSTKSMREEADTREHLQALVEALEGAFISTWQSTAAWQKELDAAREYLNRRPQQSKEETSNG